MATTQREPANLQRSLHVPGLVAHYITSVIGVGVLILPGHAAAVAGPLSLAAWALLIVYSYPLALIFARLSVRHPTSRGIAEFVEEAFGPRVAHWVAALLMLALIIANPVLGLAAARYLLNIWDDTPGIPQIVLIGYLIMIGSILFNLLGVKISARVQTGVLATLIGFLVIVMVIAMPEADAANLDPVAPHGWLALGQALIICFFGFIGWENAAPVAEEVVDPHRTFPRAIFLAVFGVGALYLAMAVTVTLVLPPGAAKGEQITAFATLLQVASGREMSQVGNVVAIVLLLLATNAWVLGTSRVIFSSAREGMLPAVLTKVSGRNSVPYGALLFLIPGYGVPVGLLALTRSSEMWLITATSATFLLIFLATFLAAHRLLEGRAIRRCNILLIIVTACILPFFGISIVYAAALAILAYVLTVPKVKEWMSNGATRRVRQENES
ncbi:MULTISPECIES: APC family permease [Thermomonosporaceae]|uniref:APC family permease n=1 Tax=Thermomonosporaceae TaxID=2012 RepID=UPI00255A9463|nr:MULTISPECIES: APC family permease [Thermomonosporaceae]MDL4773927.1 APC family permease [Actinomadura xylanilytica]